MMLRYCLFTSDAAFDWQQLVRDLEAAGLAAAEIQPRTRHAVLSSRRRLPIEVRQWLSMHRPQLHVLSVGTSIQVYKDEGTPAEITGRYGFAELAGSHAVGHTRMATESAVSPLHAHPFTAGQDFCLVHNGSLSNHHSLRRMLERRGVAFETDNDTEAACRFLEWRLREARRLAISFAAGVCRAGRILHAADGHCRPLVLVRDAFACKPAVVAETDEYVAMASEFRGLAGLPGVRQARLFEPLPEEIYSWKV